MSQQETDTTQPPEFEEGSPEAVEAADAARAAVTELLDGAIAKAQEANMATSELLGLFNYYEHCIAASYRESVMQQLQGGDQPG